MRRTRPASFVLGLSSAALALALAGCSDTTTPGTTTLSAAEVSEIGAAEGDEVEQAVGALTTPLADGAMAPTAPGCATVDAETDSDGDLAPDEATRLAKTHHGAVALSAQSGEGITEFLNAVGDRLRALTEVVELFVPFDRGDVLASVHREGEVVSESAGHHGMRVRARLEPASRHRLRAWVVDGDRPAAVVE